MGYITGIGFLEGGRNGQNTVANHEKSIASETWLTDCWSHVKDSASNISSKTFQK